MAIGEPMQGMAGASQGARSRLEAFGLGDQGDAGPGPGAGKRALGDVRYRAADNPAMSCGGCLHFQQPNACELVAGNIDPQATCDLFEARGPEQIPAVTPQAPVAAPAGAAASAPAPY